MSTGGFAQVTRWFLYLLIASIGVGALLAILVILAGNWSWFETRVLLTTGSVAGASVCGMACGSAMSRYRSPWLPGIGIGLAILAAVMLIAGMWTEAASSGYWRATASVAIFAVAVAHVALLSIARVQPSHRWVQLVAGGAALTFAALLVLIINASHVDDGTVRLLAVVGILDAALTLVVPIVYFLDRRSGVQTGGGTEPDGIEGSGSLPPSDVASIDAEIARLQAQIDELRARRQAMSQAAATSSESPG
jgi:hypothetical protein